MSDDFPLRIETLLEQCGGNRDVGGIILDEFIIQVADDVNEIEVHLASGDLVRVGKVGHRLKGTAGVLGATKLHALCQILETAGKEGNAEDITKTYPDLKAEIERCVAAVPEARNRL